MVELLQQVASLNWGRAGFWDSGDPGSTLPQLSLHCDRLRMSLGHASQRQGPAHYCMSLPWARGFG